MLCTVISILISRIYCITIYTKFLLHWFVRRRGEMIGYQKEFSKLTWYYCMVWHAATWMVLWSWLLWVPNIATVDWRIRKQSTFISQTEEIDKDLLSFINLNILDVLLAFFLRLIEVEHLLNEFSVVY